MLTIEEIKICVVVRIITGSLSLIASLTILMMIARSTKKLSITQNRLLFGLSLGDIFASSAVVWATFAIPEGTPNIWMPMGNQNTCDVQGFLFGLGKIISPCYTAGICIYHFLQIRYNIRDDMMSRRVEPFLHITSLLVAVAVATDQLLRKNYNPLPVHCFAVDYPRDCSSNPEVDCVRGESYDRTWSFLLAAVVVFVLTPIVIAITMSQSYYTVRRREGEMSQYRRRNSCTSDEHRETTARMEEENRHSRMVMYRGLAFSAAWLLSSIFPIIIIVFIGEERFGIEICSSIFNPMQGLFNFMIYIYPKLHVARLRNPQISWFAALRVAIRTRWGRDY